MAYTSLEKKLLERVVDKNTKWVRLWLYCLQQNTDYRTYCNAYSDKDGLHDAEACRVLETKYEFITELYYDWGDIKDIDATKYSESFQQWLEKKQYLFFPDLDAHVIDDASTYTPRNGRVLIEVPMLDSKKKIMSAIEFQISLMHMFRIPLDPPKYKLHGDYSKATQSAVIKAIYVGWFQHIRKDGKELSLSDTVIAILLQPKNPLGANWQMTESDKTAYENGRLKKSVVYASKMKQIKAYQKDFDALVKNTLFSKFPDFS